MRKPRRWSTFRRFVLVALPLAGHLGLPSTAAAQPRLRAGTLPEHLSLDGRLAEPEWASAEVASPFAQTDPVEGAAPSGATRLRVLAGPGGLVIGIECDDDDPAGLVSYSKQRDASLGSEDHVRVVIGPFLDGRSGYVFAVNPAGARYDGLIAPGGESDDPNWDGLWEAATARTPSGWSVEIRIPIQTLTFKPGLREWHFNVQRRIQRKQETSRWASAQRQFQVTQTSRAGLLVELPEFSLGLGLTVRPAFTAGGGVPGPGKKAEAEKDPSLDVMKRLGPNMLASFTANTDFAETEVDTRRTNLTRFPVLFPEKRTFFLEGSDIFSFGLGLGSDVIPYFSRRIGLVGSEEVPIIAGGKVNGRVRNTNIGALAVATNDEEDVVESEAFAGAFRVKQNIWKESWVGAIATVGDPLARSGSWLGGADFTYATSTFLRDKNFLVGVWGLLADREDLGNDRSSYGLKVDYPNDLWDLAFTYKRIGRDFDPSYGFVPRRSVHLYNLSINNNTRIAHGPLQNLFHEFVPSMATDLHGKWESYRVFFAPVNWRFRSGDRFEFNANPTGERLVDPFDISDGVTIAPGTYDWMRYRLEVGTATKRRLYAQVTYWFGGFYDGTLDQIIWTGAWNPAPLLTIEFSGERNIADLAAGSFTQTLVGTRARLQFSPDLTLASYVQYDTDTDAVGVNTRLRWTFSPAGDLFVVYNHNVRETFNRWQLDSNQLLVKLQYSLRY